MSTNLTITLERWCNDEMLPEVYFNDYADQSLVSIQRLIFHKPYREILKERSYLTEETFNDIRNAQQKAFNKVKQVLCENQLVTIKTHQSNNDFLKARLKGLKSRLEKITDQHAKILENHYLGKDYSHLIWGGAYNQIRNNAVPSDFSFTELANDQINKPRDEHNYIREKEWEYNEWRYISDCAKIVDLNIEILVNENASEHIENILDRKTPSNKGASDKRGENKKDEELIPEKAFWVKAKELYRKKKKYAITKSGYPSGTIIDELFSKNFNAYQKKDEKKSCPHNPSKSTIRRILYKNPDEWQK